MQIERLDDAGLMGDQSMSTDGYDTRPSDDLLTKDSSDQEIQRWIDMFFLAVAEANSPAGREGK